MVLVDTCIWVDFLRDGDELLKELLTQGQVMTHPLIIGELACGNISKRAEFLKLIAALPIATEATHSEVREFIEIHKLHGKGVGFVDLHILASAMLSNVPLWTGDKRLASLSRQYHKAL